MKHVATPVSLLVVLCGALTLSMGAAHAAAPPSLAGEPHLGQEASPAPARTSVVIEPLAWIYRSFGIGLERTVSPRWSWVVGATLGASVGGSDLELREGSLALRERHLMVGVEPGLAYYLTGTAPDGWWVGPRVGLELSRTFLYAEPSGDAGESGPSSTAATRFTYGLSLLGGFNKVFSNGLTVQLGAGLAAHRTHQRASEGASGLALGWHGGVGMLPAGPGSGYRLGVRVLSGLGWTF